MTARPGAARAPAAPRPGLRPAVWNTLLAGVVLAAFLPALNYGLIWDDPKWYQQGAGLTAAQLFTALPSYQFYRPLTLLYNHLLVTPDGVVAARLAHALQIAAHLAAACLLTPTLRVFGVARWPARLAALLFAVSPAAFQAVAWQAPQGPFVVLCLLLAAATAGRFSRRRHWPALFASVAAYGAALLLQESAVPFAALFAWLAVDQARAQGLDVRRPATWRRLPLWPLLHAGLAVGYLLIWLRLPRLGGVTGTGFDPRVLAYGLQAAVFPAARLAAGWLSGWEWPALLGLYAALTGALILGAAASGGPRLPLLAGLWAAAGFLPIWAGLSWDYVQVGERLLYVASPGLALFWAGWGAASMRGGVGRRVMGGLALALALGAAGQHLSTFQHAYGVGTAHLRQAVAVLAARPAGRYLFVNFPDRFETRPTLYPLGFWGITLAPPVQMLADYARAQSGQSGADETRAAFLTGADDRAAWRYRVDLRGVDSAPAALLEAAQNADAVFVSDYLADGGLRLREVGAIRPGGEPPPARALFGEAGQLTAAELTVAARTLHLRLTWHCLAGFQQLDTVFVHVWRLGPDGAEFVGGADGDSLGELVPVWEWRPGLAIVDLREVDLATLEPGRYEVRVGFYNRVSGARYPAHRPEGGPAPDDAVPIGTFELP